MQKDINITTNVPARLIVVQHTTTHKLNMYDNISDLNGPILY